MKLRGNRPRQQLSQYCLSHSATTIYAANTLISQHQPTNFTLFRYCVSDLYNSPNGIQSL